MINRPIPDVVLKTRVRDESIGGPNPFRWQDLSVRDEFAGKRVVVFSLPGAFTPTCSNEQCPNFDRLYDEFRQLGIDDVYCVSVNDAFVMGAWGRDQKTQGKVRMMADGSADFAKATGLTLDLTSRGMGLRSQRYSMLVDDGVVKTLNVEGPGKFEVSDAATLLAQAKA